MIDNLLTVPQVSLYLLRWYYCGSITLHIGLQTFDDWRKSIELCDPCCWPQFESGQRLSYTGTRRRRLVDRYWNNCIISSVFRNYSMGSTGSIWQFSLLEFQIYIIPSTLQCSVSTTTADGANSTCCCSPCIIFRNQNEAICFFFIFLK